jgi:hypothetical protein
MMEKGVRQFRFQTIFVALALIIASCQCSIACATQPCHDAASAPVSGEPSPCHKHHPSKQTKSPEGCLHVPFILDHRAPALSAPDLVQFVPLAILPAENALFAALSTRRREIPQETSPPGSPELVLSTVLRI